MTIPLKTKNTIHPSQYKLPIIGEQSRTRRYIRWIGVALLYVVAIGLTIFDLLKKNWVLEGSILPVLWGWAVILTFIFIYIEPDLVLTEKGIVLKFFFKNCRIPWEDVLKIEQDYSHTYSVYVRNLTLFNWLLGFVSFSLRPIFWVSRNFPNHEEIVKFIKYKTEEG